MKSFAGMVFGQERMISLLVLCLILAGISKPADAATLIYTSPAFSISDCQAEGYDNPPDGPSVCVGGSLTGTFTFPDALIVNGNGTVYGGDLTSWSLTALGITLSSSNGDSIDPALPILFSAGESTVGYFDAVNNAGNIFFNIDGDCCVIAAVESNSLTSFTNVGFVDQPGTWTLTPGTGTVNMAALGGFGDVPGEKCAGDPCNAGTGNEYESITDYTTSGQNPLSFTRYYNSLASSPDPYATELGSRWRNNYDRYLTVSGTSVTAERGDGQVLTFTNNGGVWSSDSDVDITLTNTGLTWTLTDHNDTVETYTQSISGEAQLQKIVARDGYTQTLAYSAGQLASVTDSYGRTLTFTYTNGLLTQVATPDTLVLTYGYTSSGVTPSVNDQLASVAYNTTPATKQVYAYVNNFDLASITDEDGNVFASWTYDSQNRALTSQHANGAERVTIAYNDTNGSRTVTGALGQQTTYTFTTLQGVPKITGISRTASATVPAGTESFTYDTNGYTSSVTDWNGNITDYVNDTHGDPLSIIEAAGVSGTMRTTTITYDSVFPQLPAMIVAPRQTTEFTYDANGNTLTRTETDTSGGSTDGQVRTWTFTYDTTGHRLTAANPLGAVTKYTYSGNNIATVTDALGHVSKITSYNGGGLPLSMTDPNGVVTTLAYDVRNRLTSRTVGGATTKFAYDAAGNLTVITLPDNAQLLYTYDAAHRVIAVKNNVGETINYTLDANDDITQQQIVGTSIAKTQTTVFDSLGRMLKQIGAYNETTAFAYDSDGNTLMTTDALNNATTSSFDALNRLISSIDPLHNTTAYGFDSQNNLTSVTDPRTLVTSYAYNGFGEVLAQVSPDTGATVYSLDAMGNRIKEIDARGVITNRTFDKLNRVLTEKYPSARDEDVTYTYDRGKFGIGRLTSLHNESGSTEFTYNARGDILDDLRTIGGRTYSTSYDYDLADHVTSITYPDRRTVTYTRDAFGRIASIALRDRPLVDKVTYEPFGPVNGFTFGNGVAETFTYDQDYRLTAILAKGREDIQNLMMVYDGVNDITSITDLIVGKDHDHDHNDHDKDHDDRDKDKDKIRSLNQAFAYDADYRLLTATGPYGAETFTYDADGNRIKETSHDHTRDYTYAATSNQLTRIAGERDHVFTYTENGDLATETDSEDKTFTYNARNRNSGIETRDEHRDGGGAKYTYNALGERVSKDPQGKDHEFNQGLTHFIYDEHGNLLAEADSFGGMTREYVYMDSLLIAVLDGDNVYYVHADNLGTPQKMTDGDQKIVWSREQQPFGKGVDVDGPATLRLRFPGQYHDTESGLNYNGFRTYDPDTGRYTQSDPIGLLAGINTYAYVGSNPVNRVDPRGEQWWKVLALIPPIIVIYEQYKEPLEPLPQPPTPGPTPPNPNVCEGPGYSPNNPLPWQTQQWQNASPQQSTPVPEVPMPPAPEQPEWPESEP